MSVETKKVLEMLAAGKISSDDAERLLDKLAAVKEPAESGATENRDGASATSPSGAIGRSGCAPPIDPGRRRLLTPIQSRGSDQCGYREQFHFDAHAISRGLLSLM